MTEIALFTGDGPRWIRPVVQAPLMRMAAKPTMVRVLNAARVEKLAARTRNYLGQFGWREVVVGNAAAMRSKSLILYPQGARAEAVRLANRLGFATAPRADVRQVTVLLGRDAAGHPALRSKA